jgi:uncharacterized phage protein gp47/JayE
MPILRPTLTELIDRTTQDMLAGLALAEPLRRNDAVVYASVLAATAHSLYGFAQWMGKQLFAHSADSEYLEQHAHYRLGFGRQPAICAHGQIIVQGTPGSSIAQNTQLQRADGAIFLTTEACITEAEPQLLSVIALNPGAVGNTLRDTHLQFISPIAGVSSTAKASPEGLNGGRDSETDASLRQRVLDAQAAWPLYGKKGDYVIWAKQVSGVTRAWEIAHDGAIQRLTLLIVCDGKNPIAPDQRTIARVQSHLEQVKPLRAEVIVATPKFVPIHYRIRLSPASAEAKATVEAELRDLLVRQAKPGGTMLLSHQRQAISNAAGEWDHELLWPDKNLMHTEREMASFGSISWVS